MKLIQKFAKWCFSLGSLPYWVIFVYDCAAVLISGIFVYLLQHGYTMFMAQLSQIAFGLAICLLVYMPTFVIFHTFNGVLRYSSFIDLHRVAYSTFTAGFVVCFLHQLEVAFGLTPYIHIPRFLSGLFIFMSATMLMWIARIAAKALHDIYRNDGIAKNTFIYGSMQGGVALAQSIYSETPVRYRICGFITSDINMTTSHLMGKARVYGRRQPHRGHEEQ